MKSLRDRLARLDRRIPAHGAADDPKGRSEELRRRLDRVLGSGLVIPASELVRQGAARVPVERFVEGRRVEAPSGTVFAAEWTAPSEHRHGDLPVAELARVDSALEELFPEHLGGVSSPEELAFLDTETTGLAGGAGTIPFLVGIGRWVSGRHGFRVVQLFLEDLDREEALLDTLARELEGVRCLVTYNGRSYDLPLMENRHVLNRRPWPLAEAPHLDLLHPARALWGHDHPDCRLTTLERRILGFVRNGDIPGSEVPLVYGAYLRRGATPRLAAVFRHNHDDILSLAGLFWAAGVAARSDGGGWPGGAMGVGLIHARRGRHRKARLALEACLRDDLPLAARRRVLRPLSLALKRDGEWERALELWAEMRRLDPADPFPVEEAAKAWEHRLGDFAAALALVEEALASRPWPPRDRAALEQRRARLRRKGAGRSGPTRS